MKDSQRHYTNMIQFSQKARNPTLSEPWKLTWVNAWSLSGSLRLFSFAFFCFVWITASTCNIVSTRNSARQSACSVSNALPLPQCRCHTPFTDGKPREAKKYARGQSRSSTGVHIIPGPSDLNSAVLPIVPVALFLEPLKITQAQTSSQARNQTLNSLLQ